MHLLDLPNILSSANRIVVELIPCKQVNLLLCFLLIYDTKSRTHHHVNAAILGPGKWEIGLNQRR